MRVEQKIGIAVHRAAREKLRASRLLSRCESRRRARDFPIRKY